MTLKPRFLFHASASSIGGSIVKPDIVADTPAASSLPIVGGRSTARADKGSFGDLVHFGAASTFAEGSFGDREKWARVLCADLPEDTLTATTKVSAEVHDVTIGVKPGFTARRISGGFAAESAKGSGEPTIRLDEKTAIDGVAIGGFGLIVELNTRLFQSYDTLSKLRTAADDPAFVKENGASLFMDRALAGRMTASPEGRLVESASRIYGTIVRSIRWADKPYPGAEIDHNIVTIPECGALHFGEIYIGSLARRLTMVRLELCAPPVAEGRPTTPGAPAPRAALRAGISPPGGVVMTMMCSDSEDNGTWGV